MTRYAAAVLTGLAAVVVGLGQPAAPDPAKVKAWERAKQEIQAAVGRQDTAATLAAARRVADAARAAFPPADERLHDSIQYLSDRLLEVDDVAAAAAARAEALALTTRAFGPDDHRTVDARIGKEYVDRLARLGADDRAALGATFGRTNRAVTLMGRGMYQDALAEAETVLHTRIALLGADHSYVALSHNVVAEVWRQWGHLAPAEAAYRAAIRVWRAAIPTHHPTTYTLVNNLATLYLNAGQLSRAEPLTREAHDLARRGGTEKNAQYVQSLHNLAAMYRRMGRYALAEPLMREEEDRARALHGDGSAEHRNALANRAEFHKALGDRARADALYARMDGYLTAAGLTRTAGYAELLHNRGALAWAARDFPTAREFQTRALDLTRELAGDDHPLTAARLGALGTTLTEVGELDRAEPLLRRAVAVLGRREKESFGYAVALNQLANWCGEAGRADERKALLDETEALRARLFGRGHPDHIVALGNLAVYFRKAGNSEAAVERFDEIFTHAGRLAEAAAAAQSEARQLASARDWAWYLNMYLSTTPAAGTPAAEEYARVLARKGGVFVRQRQMAAFRRSLAARPHAWASFLLGERAAVNRDLMVAALSPPAPAGRAAWEERVGKLRDKQNQIEVALSRLSADYRAGLGRPLPGAAAVGGALPAGAVLVDYLVYNHSTPPKTGAVWNNERRLLAYVVRPGGEVNRVELGPLDPVAKAAAAWRERYTADPPPPPAPGDPGADLKRLVWDPVAAHLGDARTVLVSPDGPLAAVPFAALPGEKPGTFLIEDGFAFATAPVPQLLPELAAPRGPDREPSLLLVGDVDFGPEDRGAEARPLPGTAAEVLTLGRAFEKAFGAKPDVLEGDAATKAAVAAAAPRHRFVHLATHGFFAAGRPAPAAARGGFELAPEAAAENPGLLSGLLFAGANAPTPDGVAAATLTAAEAAQLDLGGTDLVVLSACDTGRGRMAEGEGVLGLQRAFQVAGARATVTSLWPVHDAATARLMTGFYARLWGNQESPAAGLRGAQLALLREVREAAAAGRPLAGTRNVGPPGSAGVPAGPYWWAGFVLAGDWR